MPYSSSYGKDWAGQQIRDRLGDRLEHANVLDVGPGAGAWSTLLRRPSQWWAAVEVWGPYISRFGLHHRYDAVIVSDIRWLDWSKFGHEWDVVILGDVLEHMTKEEAIMVWDAARLFSRWVVLALPVAPWPQGPQDGNPYEEHRHHWDAREVEVFLDGVEDRLVIESYGTFVARGMVQ